MASYSKPPQTKGPQTKGPQTEGSQTKGPQTVRPEETPKGSSRRATLTEELQFYLNPIKDPQILPFDRKELVSLIDLTSLNEADTEASIAAFCPKALTPLGKVAAICVYPQFAKQVAAFLKGSGIKLAVVANFPHGGSELPPVLQEIEHSLEAGAQEIDLVFPYQAFLAGEHAPSLNFVKQCKAAAGLTTLKVILETSALSDLNLIAEATQMVVMAGADFVKTSTGKLPQGATLEAAAVILLTLKKLIPNFNRTLGFKAAGGIQDPQQAAQYLSLAKNIMGLTWPTPQTFRLGASQLLAKLTVV